MIFFGTVQVLFWFESSLDYNLFENITESNCCSVYSINIQAFHAKRVEREKTGG